MPKVSIVMPVYNGEKYIQEAIDSIYRQTYTDWELIIVLEKGSNDLSVRILMDNAQKDSRIKLIINSEKLGISKSLNRGIDIARGEYIARMDADDIAYPTRIEKQVAYLDKHKEVGVLGTDFDVTGANWKSNLVLGRENIKADLLFFVCLRHPTVMYRKSILDKYNIRYSEIYAASEDYELFNRLLDVTVIDNLSEKLVQYRRHAEAAVNRNLFEGGYVCRVVGRRLLEKLDIKVSDKDLSLLYNHCLIEWNYTVYEGSIADNFKRLNDLLEKIEIQNKKFNIYDAQSLKKVLKKRLLRAENMAKKYATMLEKREIDKVYLTSKYGLDENKIKILKFKVKQTIKKGAKRALSPFFKVVNNILWNNNQKIGKDVEKWTWDRYLRTRTDIDNVNKKIMLLNDIIVSDLYSKNLVPYQYGEKIRVVFLYQVASFWPAWESLFVKLTKDSRFDVKLLFLDETVSEMSQMNTAQEFLEQKHIPYILYQDFDLEAFAPHIFVMQTPYDHWHRKECHHAPVYKSKGYRIVYIPYGIEITDTETSRRDHFEQAVELNAWRIYTFSEKMRQDYRTYCTNARSVKGLGLPRLDSLFELQKFQLDDSIKKRVAGRPIVLWKVHFPKIVWESGKRIFITPELDEYVKFAKSISKYKDLFFVFMPHPKFKDADINKEVRMHIFEIFNCLRNYENVWIDFSDDYRPSLANADCIIIDRSAVMVEAGVTQKPVLYMSNPKYYEPLTQAIEPLVRSYYQGNTCQDMIKFLEMYKRGEDNKKEQRMLAIKECLPTFDGHATDRIIEDIIYSLENEK